ncbi:UNVERIFIED_CONTAM: hypothetical protein Sindi_2426200 [Sesamum indicum]
MASGSAPEITSFREPLVPTQSFQLMKLVTEAGEKVVVEASLEVEEDVVAEASLEIRKRCRRMEAALLVHNVGLEIKVE